jgi:glucose-1-phosphate cytidylyltransferase
MKVVIPAGTMGIFISEKSHLKPKPMIEIGDPPILRRTISMNTDY